MLSILKCSDELDKIQTCLIIAHLIMNNMKLILDFFLSRKISGHGKLTHNIIPLLTKNVIRSKLLSSVYVCHA